MKSRKLRLYPLAKFVSQEVLLEAQIQTLSSTHSVFLEKYEKKQSNFKKQFFFTKIVYSAIFSVFPLIPLITYFQLSRDYVVLSFRPTSIIFVESLLFGLFFGLQLIYFLSLRLLNIGLLISGNSFKFLETLPISRKKLNKLMLLTILRSVDIPLVAMAIAFPILLFFKPPDPNMFEPNIIAICVGFTISLLNIILSFCLLIIIGERVTRIMRVNVVNSKKNTSLRILTMLIYIVLIFGTGFLIQGVFSTIGPLLIFADQRDNSLMFSIFLSLIPYPFAPSYLLSLIVAFNDAPIELWFTTLIGFAIFCILLITIYKYTLTSFRKLSKIWVLKSQRFNYAEEGRGMVKLRPTTPLKAFLRKDLTTTSRDLETFMNISIPVIMQFIFTFSYLNTSSSSENPMSFVFFVYWAIILGFSPLISGMLVMGLTNLEDSGSSILASLPINPRDQAKAKLILLLLIQTITVISPIFLFSTNSEFLSLLTLILATLPIFWVFLFLMFIMKVRFFGKLPLKYVIEQVFPDEKFFKWSKMFGVEYIIYFCLIFLVSFLYFLSDLLVMVWVLVNLYLVVLGGLIIVFNKMFP